MIKTYWNKWNSFKTKMQILAKIVLFVLIVALAKFCTCNETIGDDESSSATGIPVKIHVGEYIWNTIAIHIVFIILKQLLLITFLFFLFFLIILIVFSFPFCASSFVSVRSYFRRVSNNRRPATGCVKDEKHQMGFLA